MSRLRRATRWLLLLVLATAPDASAGDSLRSARAAIKKGKAGEARRHLMAALAEDPMSAAAYA